MEPGRPQNPVKLTMHQYSSVCFQDCLAQHLCSCRQQPGPLSPEPGSPVEFVSAGLNQALPGQPGPCRTAHVPALPPPPHDTGRCFSSLDAVLDLSWSCGATICNTSHAGFSLIWDPPSLFSPLPWIAKSTKSIFPNCFMMTVIYWVIRSERIPQKWEKGLFQPGFLS